VCFGLLLRTVMFRIYLCYKVVIILSWFGCRDYVDGFRWLIVCFLKLLLIFVLVVSFGRLCFIDGVTAGL